MQKVAPLKRGHRDSEKRGFHRQLKDEGEKAGEDTVDINAGSRKRDSEGQQQKQPSVSNDDGNSQNPDGKKKQTDASVPGSVVDIRV